MFVVVSAWLGLLVWDVVLCFCLLVVDWLVDSVGYFMLFFWLFCICFYCYCLFGCEVFWLLFVQDVSGLGMLLGVLFFVVV